MTVAVGFSPRFRTAERRVAERRLTRGRLHVFKRHSVTRNSGGRYPWAEAHGLEFGHFEPVNFRVDGGGDLKIY